MKKDNNYIPQITILRFFAAILVVVFHFGKNTFPLDSKVLSPLIDQGAVAVSFFFFLSGYVLTINYKSFELSNLKAFYIKRFSRIYPIYIFSFILALFLTIIWNNQIPKGFSIILQLLGLHAWSPGNCLEMNFPSWSVSVELFFYLLFPFLLILSKRIKFILFSILTLSIWIISILIFHLLMNHIDLHISPHAMGQFTLYFPLWHLNTFIFGVLGGLIYEKIKSHKQSIRYSEVIFLISIITIVIILTTENSMKSYAHNGILSPIYLVLIISLSLSNGFLSKLFSYNLSVYLGEISYSMYLLQYPLYLIYSKTLSLENINGHHLWIYLILLISLSGLAYKYIERKAQKKINYRLF